ncbi:MAG: UDP-N-acetylglucosamine--N-acetylmuramyl-(pentapeptide) pyrophosphoryl-undecaprenol N-acetylglucosamine transferase [Lentisphaeria bacterium]|nr:UDP-N-acetylglucosamine--N-acetylmuramyl-(pentapeptide) pyrophosphoryl-undecaprenol N-acetylglucosamine transferase [Lentisphaeria bacterium]
MKDLKRIAITCGGTGGHFNPGLSIAQEFNAAGGEAILLLGGKHAEKQLKIAAECGVKAYKIPASPLSKNLFRLIRFALDALKGRNLCRKIMQEHKVQALLSMGSYTSIPPYLAAYSRKIPFFLHDGNARLGKANLAMSKRAKAFAFSFPSVNASGVKCPAELTGFPLRAQLLQCRLTREEAFATINETFGATFDPEQPTLLVFGGSLGAERINRNIDFTSPDLQVIHLTGPGKKEQAETCYAGKPNKVLVLESFEDMGLLYTAADFVISRAGGSTVSELAYFGKYALLIPYPFAAQQHQDDNAAWLASAGGAEVVADADCTATLFRSMIDRWVANRDAILAAGERSRALAMPDAAAKVIAMIRKYL